MEGAVWCAALLVVYSSYKMLGLAIYLATMICGCPNPKTRY